MPLAEQQIRERLAGITGWEFDGTRIARTYAARTFPHAIAMTVLAGSLAETADHHPDIVIRYNRVTFELRTHSDGGVTEKDLAMAQRLNETFEGMAA